MDIAGDRALRKSVYAEGGVIGVFISSSSCLIASKRHTAGLFGKVEGSASGTGVMMAAGFGFGDFGASMTGSSVFSGSLSSFASVLVSTFVSTSVADDIVLSGSGR